MEIGTTVHKYMIPLSSLAFLSCLQDVNQLEMYQKFLCKHIPHVTLHIPHVTFYIVQSKDNVALAQNSTLIPQQLHLLCSSSDAHNVSTR